jgi:hypothetical protein
MPTILPVREIIFNDGELGMGFNSEAGLAVGTALEAGCKRTSLIHNCLPNVTLAASGTGFVRHEGGGPKAGTHRSLTAFAASMQLVAACNQSINQDKP